METTILLVCAVTLFLIMVVATVPPVSLPATLLLSSPKTLTPTRLRSSLIQGKAF
jgi:hypothetical protein